MKHERYAMLWKESGDVVRCVVEEQLFDFASGIMDLWLISLPVDGMESWAYLTHPTVRTVSVVPGELVRAVVILGETVFQDARAFVTSVGGDYRFREGREQITVQIRFQVVAQCSTEQGPWK